LPWVGAARATPFVPAYGLQRGLHWGSAMNLMPDPTTATGRPWLTALLGPVAGAVGLSAIAAVLGSPISGAILYILAGPFEGWRGSAVSQVLGWALLDLPLVLVLGTAIALAYRLFDTRILHGLPMPIRFATLVPGATLAFGLIACAPNYVTASAVGDAVLIYLPVWITFGCLNLAAALAGGRPGKVISAWLLRLVSSKRRGG
jgi:hypothetical protein